ncbi:MAG: nitronate monooxygenase [Micavibrio sp.]|nr:nitronate monooxygenase [Micavibrio sp.]
MQNNPVTPRDILAAGTDLPVIVAPMFLISTPDLVVAACKEGMIGSLPAASQWTSAGFDGWLTDISARLDALRQSGQKPAPYAINLGFRKITPRLEADVDLCVKHKVPVILASGDIPAEMVKKIHAYGGIVLQDVASADEAKRAVKNGVDGVIAVTAGAGGQGSSMNPLALLGEIRQFFDGVVALAGCVTTGQDILAAKAMGADMAVMGTRFICTQESAAEPEYKEMIKKATADDIIHTSAISGYPANFLKDSILAAGFDAAKLKKEGAGADRIQPPPGEASKAWKTVWSAGQGSGGIHDIPTVAALTQKLAQEYADAENALLKKLGYAPRPQSPKPSGPKP